MEYAMEISELRQLALMIERIQINFKKDSASRKNLEYFRNRLTNLETYWHDFSDHHHKLIAQISPDHPYALENVFLKTEEVYQNIKHSLQLGISNLQTDDKLEGALTSSSVSASAQDTVPYFIATQPTSASVSQNMVFSSAAQTMVPPTSISVSTNSQDTVPYFIASQPTSVSVSQNMVFSSAAQTMVPPTSASVSSIARDILSVSTQQTVFPCVTRYYTTQSTPEHHYSFVNTVPGTLCSPVPITNMTWNNVTHPQIRRDDLTNLQTNNAATSYDMPYYTGNLPKLPSIQIPPFNGDIKKWRTFFELFTSTIDKNPTISAVIKMQYLQSLLQEKAKNVIKHLNISGNNYATALILLKDRFDNPRELISSYVNSILEIKKINNNSFADIIMMHDLLKESLAALENTGCVTASWSPMIVCIVTKKLDSDSLRVFEETLHNPNEMPSLDELLRFLLRRYHVLQATRANEHKIQTHNNRSFPITKQQTCLVCQNTHSIMQCTEFKNLGIQQRYQKINQLKLCENCLSHDRNKKCPSKHSCFTCKKRHHTLLHGHFDKTPTVTTSLMAKNSNSILLSTALVRMQDNMGQYQMFRALIDPGSQANFITERTAQRLGLPRQRADTAITGIGLTNAGKVKGMISIRLTSCCPSKYEQYLDALVLKKLTGDLPEAKVPEFYTQSKHFKLADPTYATPGPIDVILGAEIYSSIVLKGIRKGNPTALNTKLGWILLGSVPNREQNSTSKLQSFISTTQIDKQLKQFFEMETKDDDCNQAEDAEKSFKHGVTRELNGRYSVVLPFKKTKTNILGDSKKRAMARLLQMENKLRLNSILKKEYSQFIQEYIDLGHMSLAKEYIGDNSKVFYLPHHAVFKEDSSTTKIRVVFDGSCKTSTGVSLNDLLQTGPKLQRDLSEIITKWRLYRYVYTADIEKMFRQILIADSDRDYQRILWRDSFTGQIQEYRLNTVTYGTASATFLAVRALLQLAEDEKTNFPQASAIMKNDFYVDDLMTGAHSASDAYEIQKQLTNLMKKGGFNLRKWNSNMKSLLCNVPENQKCLSIHEIKNKETIKTLGIFWNPESDHFIFNRDVKIDLTKTSYSKREVLSLISSYFDPLGWLAPTLITSKIFMQELWETGIGWDDDLPEELYKKWMGNIEQLQSLYAIQIPRWTQYTPRSEIELHGFCDASMKAFAAAVYLRIRTEEKITTTLLSAKTRVAPLNKKLTLPKLELCGAALLANLLFKTKQGLQMNECKVYAWGDSTIALAWIQKEPKNWKEFVSNRVGEIRRLTNPSDWFHISSEDNPADCASRGIGADHLKTHTLWWHGPSWLALPETKWPITRNESLTTQEEIRKKSVFAFPIVYESFELLEKYSSFNRLVRILAYILRFTNNCRLNKDKFKTKATSHLSMHELASSRNKIIRMVQQQSFPDDIDALVKQRKISTTSKLLSLNPFIDDEGILRVGGRLQNSGLKFESKHQAILPQHHHVTAILIREVHERHFHAGVQLTLNTIRANMWIINAKRIVQTTIHRCIKCAKAKACSGQQIMGNLPSERVNVSPPFSNCGIDFAGPFQTRMSKGRGSKTYKSYISVFVCLTTKAIHLELVSDLTTEAFMAAYKRFTARRGHCKMIQSDNGTNFLGASKVLDKELRLAINNATEIAAELLSNDGTVWKFNPPAAPNFGGIWEAAVKSVKTHLRKSLQDANLTFEEFNTILYQIEACLNSRPLSALSNDPDDLEALTPGHFLIGRSLIHPPEYSVSNNQLKNRWKLVTKLKQDIWKRWSSDYLTTLQQRNKWKIQFPNFEINELVLVKEDNLPTAKWLLGRVISIHPGDDGRVRVVTLKTKGKNPLVRPVSKLCKLPLDSSDNMPIPNEEHTVASALCKKRKFTDDAPKTKISKPKISPCLWHYGLLLLGLILTALGEPTNYEIFTPEPGLYIESLGTCQIKRGHFRLELQFGKEQTVSDRNNAEATIKSMQTICNQHELREDSHCKALLNHLKEKSKSILQQTEKINDYFNPKSKRGLFGNLLQAVFGVNEEVYADIDSLNRNQLNMFHSSNQQVLLINRRINNINEVIKTKLNAFENKLNAEINAINQMRAAWFDKVDENRLEIVMLSVYSTANLFLDELKEKYDNIIQAIYGKATILNFLPLGEIHDIIANATVKLSSNLLISHFPEERVDIGKDDENFKIYGYFHIYEAQFYELIHVTPVPRKLNDSTFSVAIIKQPTLAINYDSQTYFEMDEEELSSCVSTAGNNILCTPMIVSNIETNQNCVIDQIYNRSSKIDCNSMHVRIAQSLWKQLRMENSWLFITTTPVQTAVICNGKREETIIKDVGIIKVNKNCFIKTKRNTLRSSVFADYKVRISYNKGMNLTTLLEHQHHPLEVLDLEPVIKPDEELFAHAESTYQPPPTSVTPHIAISATGCLLTLLFIFIGIRIKTFKSCRLWKWKTDSSPSEPTQLDTIFTRVLAASSAAPQNVHAEHTQNL